MEATLALVAGLVAHLRAGRTVIVHCLAGLGRTGTVAACCLVACGRPPGRAIELVRGARPGAVQTEAQAEFVARFAEAWWRPQASAR
jgi:protein-tyrosine phosphatase